MSDKVIFTNNAASTLASGITAVATSIFLNPGDGAKFPSPGANQFFPVTLADASGNIEIVYCTTRATDTLTVVREREGTVGTVFASGDVIELRLTAQVTDLLVQQGLKGYSAAGGTVDAITMTMDPTLDSLGAAEDGLVVFLKASGAPTILTPTLNIDGTGAKTIVKYGNQELLDGDIPRANYECLLRYNSTTDKFEFFNPYITAKVPVKDWGTVSTGTQIDLEDAELHIIEISANLTLTFAAANANDKATICIHNAGGYTISVAGIDNNSPTLTVGTNIQDILGLIKSHGKITLVGLMDNVSAA